MMSKLWGTKYQHIYRQIAQKGALFQTYSRNRVVLKLIPQWCSFLRNLHAKITQTASATGAFAADVTRGTQTASATGAFAAMRHVACRHFHWFDWRLKGSSHRHAGVGVQEVQG